MKNNFLTQVEQFSKKQLSYSNDSAHNFDHVQRVYNLCLKLAQGEDIDLDVLKISAYLHDIGGLREIKDKTGKVDHAVESAKMAEPFLKKLGLHDEKIKHIKECILSHRYRTDNKPQSLEAKILFDADKLDAIGAIGIARQYCWVGRNNALIYTKDKDVEKYIKENINGDDRRGRLKDKSKHSPQIDWEMKGKHILEFLYTDKAKKIAKERMKFLERFFDKLEREVKGLE